MEGLEESEEDLSASLEEAMVDGGSLEGVLEEKEDSIHGNKAYLCSTRPIYKAS
jgi:hypothetical protein